MKPQFILMLAALAPAVAQNGAVPPPQPAALADDMLEGERGGEAMVVSNQTLLAISEGSAINGDYSAGTVSLSDSALSGFNGIGNIVINTGAQNNLQAGMNVTINLVN
jgi:hypothetical protein